MSMTQIELAAEADRLRACICAIIEAADEGDYDALFDAIDDARAEAAISAVRAAGGAA
jgi:hypothetical protein